MGCDKPSQDAHGSAPVFNPVPIPPASQADLDALRTKVENLAKSVDAFDRPASLKLSDSGFSTIRTEYGAVTIQWDASKSTGAGTLLTFTIGNPHAATLKDITIFGHAVGSDGGSIASETPEMKIKGDARPGTWSKVTAIMDDVPPGKIASLQISGITIGRISLTDGTS